MIYLDSCATTKPNPEVLATYQRVANEYWYNTHSSNKLGLMAHALLEQAQEVFLKNLNLNEKTKQVLFTKGGSEANNYAIFGICNPYLGQNKHIITTRIEHPSTSACFEDLSTKGFKVTYLDVDSNGLVDLRQLQNELTKDTILVSLQWVNNIIGSIQPIQKIIDILKDYPRTKLHVDGIQGIGKVPFDYELNDVDLFTVSAHKINGLKGAGVLIHNKGLNLDLPLKSSNKADPGTVDLPSVIAFAKALQITLQNQEVHLQKVKILHQFLKEEISKNANFIINGSNFNFSPYILNFSIINKNSETTMHFLEQFEIYVSTGSACSSKLKKPEPTIFAISKDEKRALSSIRIGLSAENTIEDLKKLVEYLNIFCPIKKA